MCQAVLCGSIMTSTVMHTTHTTQCKLMCQYCAPALILSVNFECMQCVGERGSFECMQCVGERGSFECMQCVGERGSFECMQCGGERERFYINRQVSRCS